MARRRSPPVLEGARQSEVRNEYTASDELRFEADPIGTTVYTYRTYRERWGKPIGTNPMTFEEAVAADRRGDLIVAAEAYEKLLAEGEASLEVSLNLAVLYWQATEYGVAAAKQLSPDFMARASRRCRELLVEAQRRFSRSTEVRFWQRYIAWADLNESFEIDECWDLLREDPTTLVPAMRIFDQSDGKEAEAEALELLRQCKADGTTRAQYVTSIIEATLLHTGKLR